MYEAYFGLQERPFSKTPDPRFLFLSKGHREALARMQYAVEERDLVLLTGEIGCGKTTLLRLAAGLEQVQEGEVEIGGQVVARGGDSRQMPPEKRGVGLMFQDYALFPHLTIFENIQLFFNMNKTTLEAPQEDHRAW